MAAAAPAIAIGSSLFGAGMSIYGAKQSADAFKKQEKGAKLQGRFAGEQIRQETIRILSSQRVAAATGGRNPDVGSVPIVAEDTRRQQAFKMDAAVTAGMTQAANFGNAAKQARIEGYSSAAGSLFSGAQFLADMKLGQTGKG